MTCLAAADVSGRRLLACNFDAVVDEVIGQGPGCSEAGPIAGLHVFWICRREGVVHSHQALLILIPLKQGEVCIAAERLTLADKKTSTLAIGGESGKARRQTPIAQWELCFYFCVSCLGHQSSH